MVKNIKSIKCPVGKKGLKAKIDLSFYPKYKKYNWLVNNRGYIYTNINKNGKRKQLYLAHYVMGFKYSKKLDLMVDHKYHDTFDNRKKKLCIVSRSINVKNTISNRSNTGIPGIHINEENTRCFIHFTIKKKRQAKSFSLKNKIQNEVIENASNNLTDIKLNDDEYRKADYLDDNVSSSGISIEECDYEYKLPNKTLCSNNTSEYNNIIDKLDSNVLILTYYDKKGKIHNKRFPYGSGTIYTKKECLENVLNFQKSKEKYHPKNNKNKKNNEFHETKYGKIINYYSRNHWIVTYYDKEGKYKRKQFSYGPRSKKNQEEALEEAIIFQKSMKKYYKKYHPKFKKNNSIKNKKNIKKHNDEDTKSEDSNDTDSISMQTEEKDIEKGIILNKKQKMITVPRDEYKNKKINNNDEKSQDLLLL